jgi:hypothetical protein
MFSVAPRFIINVYCDTRDSSLSLPLPPNESPRICYAAISRSGCSLCIQVWTWHVFDESTRRHPIATTSWRAAVALRSLLGDGTALDRVFCYTAISSENEFPRSGSLTASHHPQTDEQTEILMRYRANVKSLCILSTELCGLDRWGKSLSRLTFPCTRPA